MSAVQWSVSGVASLLEYLAANELRVAVAESLTGGLLADAIISVPGASRVFSGGIVAYDTRLKHSLLGVDAELLRTRGPVDEEVARQMASGVRVACALEREYGAEAVPADIGISTTGVAGPDADAQTGQAPGTVWVGLSSKLGERAVQFTLGGDRSDVRSASVRAAIEELAVEVKLLGGPQAEIGEG